MATMQGWGMDEEAARMGSRLPTPRAGGSGGGGGAPSAPPQAPSARRLGAFTRGAAETGINTALRAVERGFNLLTAPVRAAVNTGAEFGMGLAGSDAAAPKAPEVKLGEFRFARPGVAAPANPSGPQNGRGGPRNPAARTPARPAVASGASAPTAAPTAGAPNTFTFSDGRTVEVPVGGAPSAAAPAPAFRRGGEPAAPAPSTFDANAAVAPAVDAQRRVARQVRGDAGAMLNPASQEAELMRRAENAAGSYFLKGRPSARAAIVGANLGQIEAGNAASAQFQRGAGEAINTGATGAVQQGLAAQANEGAVRLQREKAAGDVALEAQRQDAPSQVVGADGVVRFVRGTQAAPVTDEAGNPLRAPASPAPGQLTPKDLLQAYTSEREAIAGSLGTAEEKAAALAALDANPLYGPIVGQGAGAGAAPPSLETFLSTARAANPGKTDAELTAYYQQTYGAR